MITLTWFECIQLVGVIIMALLMRPMLIATRRSEAEVRAARMHDGEELAAALQPSRQR